MEVTEFGIAIFDNDEHPKKQLSSIEVTEFGIAIFENEE
jgi:hypothetical protein